MEILAMIELKKLIRQLEKELADLDWMGQDTTVIRARLDMLKFKVSIGETHEVNF
jgi:hypothetical protein